MTDKTGGAAQVCEAFELTKLSRAVLELAFIHLPVASLTEPRHKDPQVTEALVRCAAVIGSIAVGKMVDTFEPDADAFLSARDEG